MGWIKKSKTGPIDLGTAHLDSIVEPNTYIQPFASRATKANGYPFDGVAGTLEVLPWNPSNGNVIVVFHSWDRGSAKRTYYNGLWRPWLDMIGKAVT